MKIFKKLLFLLTPHERKRGGLLLIMIFIMSVLDMTGVASILPFMAVLTNPSIIETNLIINSLYQASSVVGVENNQEFIFVLGAIVLALLIISLTFKALTTYAQVRFVQMREYTIGKRLIEGYLNQPYSWFLSRNSADLGKTILSEVQQLILNGMRPMMELIAKGMVTFALITLLIIVDPVLTLIIGFSLSVAYLTIFYFVKKYLYKNGSLRLFNNELRFKSLNEAFGAAKEVKIGGLEQSYINRFSNSAQIFAKTQASYLVVAQLPRFILEAIAFGGILAMMLIIMANTGSFNSALPIVSLYVFAGYRLLPALQQIYEAFTALTFVGPSLNKLYDDLKNLKSYNEVPSKEIFTLKESIKLININYNYPATTRKALENISLSIPAKSIVGIVGATGSGKTTIVDIILGLLEPQHGDLKVDGKNISRENSRSWQRSIGYVPQQIYLSDDTVASNIAFGVEPKEVNYKAVVRASKIANIHDFVENELSKKYQTTIGERGIRLSGGQRQRIGIARALYHNPELLILDEATSGLDYDTEKAVMDAINNLGKKITIILIAHRLNTVKKCDIIYKINYGKLISQGKYEELF